MHTEHPSGWVIGWGNQGADIQVIRRGFPGEVTDEKVAGYLAKYSTKSTEATGLVASKITPDTVEAYTGRETHPSRLIGACWRLGHPKAGGEWPRLRRWAHMLGFGGHFSTRSRRYSTTLKTCWNGWSAISARSLTVSAERRADAALGLPRSSPGRS